MGRVGLVRALLAESLTAPLPRGVHSGSPQMEQSVCLSASQRITLTPGLFAWNEFYGNFLKRR